MNESKLVGVDELKEAGVDELKEAERKLRCLVKLLD